MVITADLHIGKVSDSILIDGEYSQLSDTESRLNELLSVAMRTGKSVVIAGDVFHKVNPTTLQMSYFFDWLGTARKNKTHVHIISGNHDCGVNWANMDMLSGFDDDYIHIHSLAEVAEVDEHRVYFIPHIPPGSIEAVYGGIGEFHKYIAEESRGCDMVISHGVPRGGINDYQNEVFFEAGNAMEIPIELLEVDLIIMGHIHKRWAILNSKKQRILYPGSPIITNFGEVEEDKGYLTVNGREWEYHDFESEITPYKDVVIDLVSKDEVDLNEKKLKALVSGAVIKITVQAKSRLLVDEVEITRAFNKFGYVSRFDIVTDTEYVKLDDEPEKLELEFSHAELMEKYVDASDVTDEVKELAKKIGNEVIEEVLNA